MRRIPFGVSIAVALSLTTFIVECVNLSDAFQSIMVERRGAAASIRIQSTSSLKHHVERRDVIATILGLSTAQLLKPSNVVLAEDEDLVSSLFNPDGSLKEGVESEARFRTVSIGWDTSDSFARNIDGVNDSSTKSGSDVMLSYRLPLKWATGSGGDDIYFDRTEGVNAKACSRITLFRAQGGEATEARLEKASTVGIAKSLEVPDDLALLESADLISGRTSTRNGQRYFEFDFAVAPKTCDKSKEDLGLGFCPYDSIYLLSATVLDGHLYVLAIESDKSEWKRANSDLKVVRSSFIVRPS